MKLLFTAIALGVLMPYMKARADQPDLIESGALREDGKRFTEYHRAPRLDLCELEQFRSAFLRYVTDSMKPADAGEASSMLKQPWQFVGEMSSRSNQTGSDKGKVVGLIYKTEMVTVLVFDDVVFAQWVVENPSATTRKKQVLVAPWDGTSVKQITIEE